jgi:signal transduction histidine kinase
MTSIKGYADLLLLGAAGEISDQQQRFLETIKQNADRLSILVNDLLDISRIDQGRMELRFTEVEVPLLLDDVSKHLGNRSRDEGRPMEIAVSLPEDGDLTVWGDHDKIQQIMINLADNAFNYTPPDGTITLGAYPVGDGDHVVISLADTGIGIPPEAADRVYERFFRGDETDDLVMDTPGTGLGLSIVKELVEVHQGRIWFESELEQGTTFFIELPSGASGQAQAAHMTQVEAQE